MMRCGYCGRYVREHRTFFDGHMTEERRLDRHTEAPFSPVWCPGGGMTVEETQMKGQPEPPVTGAKP